jgi:hypothetical protein
MELGHASWLEIEIPDPIFTMTPCNPVALTVLFKLAKTCFKQALQGLVKRRLTIPVHPLLLKFIMHGKSLSHTLRYLKHRSEPCGKTHRCSESPSLETPQPDH